ncbi:hypothetical protein [Streptomyces cacaoi]|uniref:hypothetical protein n=1 Tax=Streptomyces cacaoi TaxID=1898 RepID=UPI00262288A1|nr:hypothetical protein [Streptomyces cacaoi]
MSTDTLMRRFGDRVACVAQQPPDRTLAGFAEQLSVAAGRLEQAGLDDGGVSMAAVYLADAAAADSDAEHGALIERATQLLEGAGDALDRYRFRSVRAPVTPEEFRDSHGPCGGWSSAEIESYEHLVEAGSCHVWSQAARTGRVVLGRHVDGGQVVVDLGRIRSVA